LVGNVETFANLALIARYGPGWYRAAGTPDAPGTMLLTVSGAVVRPGVLEVPVGTPAREVLRAADAVADPAAVLVGGYGGAWLPGATAGAHSLDPESMAAAGAALGPGIVHVLPRGGHGLARTADIARWMAGESAGQCGPCRFGLRALSADLDLAIRGAGDAMERLRRRLALLPRRGGCAHPDGVARLVASALAVFGTEPAG
jgi:NADH:ubiquinone oxidoreductase subunit F (NADH-binding)